MPDIDSVVLKPFDRGRSRSSEAVRRFQTLAAFDVPKDDIPVSSRSAVEH